MQSVRVTVSFLALAKKPQGCSHAEDNKKTIPVDYALPTSSCCRTAPAETVHWSPVGNTIAAAVSSRNINNFTHLSRHTTGRGGLSHAPLPPDEYPLQALLVHEVLEGGVELAEVCHDSHCCCCCSLSLCSSCWCVHYLLVPASPFSLSLCFWVLRLQTFL